MLFVIDYQALYANDALDRRRSGIALRGNRVQRSSREASAVRTPAANDQLWRTAKYFSFASLRIGISRPIHLNRYIGTFTSHRNLLNTRGEAIQARAVLRTFLKRLMPIPAADLECGTWYPETMLSLFIAILFMLQFSLYTTMLTGH